MEVSKEKIIISKKAECLYDQKIISLTCLKKENEKYNSLISVHKKSYLKLVVRHLDEIECNYRVEYVGNYYEIYIYTPFKKEKFLSLSGVRTLIDQYSA